MTGAALGRIGFLGNVCNLYYDMAARLRERGQPTSLLAVNRFVQEDPYVANRLTPGSVDWIHLRPYGGRTDTQLRPSPEQLQALKSCRTAHGQGPWLAWARQAGLPYVWQPYGSDFYSMPFPRLGLGQPLSRTSPRLLAANVSSMVKETVIARRIRPAIRDASAVAIIGWFDRHWTRGYELLREMDKLSTLKTLPFPIDCEAFRPGDGDKRWPDESLQQRLARFDVVAFYPSRQLFTTEGKKLDGMRPDDPGKRNDVLYRALAQARRQGVNVGVVIVDKNNPDTAVAKRMVADLGLESAVFWIPPMPRADLVGCYRAADLVVDCFGGGAPGSITFESMACGTPVMQWIDYDAGRDWGLPGSSFYPTPLPLLNCRDESQIVEVLGRASRSSLRELGQDARRWVVANADISIALDRVLDIHRALP